MKNRKEWQGVTVVLGVALAAGVWIQATRAIHVGLPGSMPRPQAVVTQQADRETDKQRVEASDTLLTKLIRASQ